jgi:superfamily I DNA/RNA helicase
MGTPPNKVGFLTFTRAAKHEVFQRIGKTEKDFPFMRTIHSMCYQALQIGKDQIVRPETLKQFARAMGIKLTAALHDPWIEDFNNDGISAPTRDDFLIAANHMGRHRGINLKEALQGMSMEIDYNYAVWFTRAYKEWKHVNGLLDYTDLLTRYVEYGRPLPIEAIFVDEAQDLSILQWAAVDKLGAEAERRIVAGDDDQAIFYWAGADPHVFQDLVADKTEVLSQSYRVSKAVHQLAAGVTSRIKKRLVKNYSPTESEGYVGQAGTLSSVDFSERTFILFRNNYRGQELAAELKRNEIPFIGKGSVLYDSDIRLAMLAFYQIVKLEKTNSAGIKAIMRFSDHGWFRPDLVDLLKKKTSLTIEEVFIREPKLKDWDTVLDKIPKIEDIQPLIDKVGFARVAFPRVELLSIHQSKGREAHTVVLDPEMSKATFLGMVNSPDDEHRVWYVGATRAKERVLLLIPDGMYSYRF